MNKNYELLIKFISDSDDVTEYSFDGIEQELDKFLQLLPERQHYVIKEHFGLKDGRTKTLEEVAIPLEVTRERVRQIEGVSIKKLRRYYALNNNSFIFDADTIIENAQLVNPKSTRESSFGQKVLTIANSSNIDDPKIKKLK